VDPHVAAAREVYVKADGTGKIMDERMQALMEEQGMVTSFATTLILFQLVDDGSANFHLMAVVLLLISTMALVCH
jgi:hypothetical protein